MTSPQAEAINEKMLSFRAKQMKSEGRPAFEEIRRAVNRNNRLAMQPTGVSTTEATAELAQTLEHEPDGGGDQRRYLHFHGGGLATPDSQPHRLPARLELDVAIHLSDAPLS